MRNLWIRYCACFVLLAVLLLVLLAWNVGAGSVDFTVGELLAALADDTRRQILQKLREGKISSGDLAVALHMTPQALSYHLAKLKRADLIYETRSGNFIFYEPNLSVLDEIILWIDRLREGDYEEEENPV